MKKLVLLYLFTPIAITFAQTMNDISIIPEPVNLKVYKGYFLLDKNTGVSTNELPGAKNIGSLLQEYIDKHYNIKTGNGSHNPGQL